MDIKASSSFWSKQMAQLQEKDTKTRVVVKGWETNQYNLIHESIPIDYPRWGGAIPLLARWKDTKDQRALKGRDRFTNMSFWRDELL